MGLKRVDTVAQTVEPWGFRIYEPIVQTSVAAYQVQAGDVSDGETVAYFVDAVQVHTAAPDDYVVLVDPQLPAFAVVRRATFESRYRPPA